MIGRAPGPPKTVGTLFPSAIVGEPQLLAPVASSIDPQAASGVLSCRPRGTREQPAGPTFGQHVLSPGALPAKPPTEDDTHARDFRGFRLQIQDPASTMKVAGVLTHGDNAGGQGGPEGGSEIRCQEGDGACQACSVRKAPGGQEAGRVPGSRSFFRPRGAACPARRRANRVAAPGSPGRRGRAVLSRPGTDIERKAPPSYRRSLPDRQDACVSASRAQGPRGGPKRSPEASSWRLRDTGSDPHAPSPSRPGRRQRPALHRQGAWLALRQQHEHDVVLSLRQAPPDGAARHPAPVQAACSASAGRPAPTRAGRSGPARGVPPHRPRRLDLARGAHLQNLRRRRRRRRARGPLPARPRHPRHRVPLGRHHRAEGGHRQGFAAARPRGVSYALAEASGQGHCGLPHAELVPLAVKLLEIEPGIIEAAIAEEIAAGVLVADTSTAGRASSSAPSGRPSARSPCRSSGSGRRRGAARHRRRQGHSLGREAPFDRSGREPAGGHPARRRLQAARRHRRPGRRQDHARALDPDHPARQGRAAAARRPDGARRQAALRVDRARGEDHPPPARGRPASGQFKRKPSRRSRPTCWSSTSAR